jgi:hypothetical protein
MLGRKVMRHSPAQLSSTPMVGETADEIAKRLIAQQIAQQKKETEGGSQAGLGSALGGLGGSDYGSFVQGAAGTWT